MSYRGACVVLNAYADIAAFIPHVVAAADQNKNALGFFAKSVFHEFAMTEQIYVAVNIDGDKASYVGHLMFKCTGAKASVLQMFVTPEFRSKGVAKLLLDHLKLALTKLGFISIHARVAEDLADANIFWQKQDFYVQRIAPGGSTRRRTILVRSHELKSQQLFASSGVSSTNPLGVVNITKAEAPLFLLDLNVLFDLGARRLRNEDALDLFRAERMGICQLAISSELSNELLRTATVGRTDPMQAYARIFPVFSIDETEQWKSLLVDLAALIFQDKTVTTLSDNDKSDVRHLATAIQHRLAGFITNDVAILASSVKLRSRYDIQVVSPTIFKQSNPTDVIEHSFNTPAAETLELRPMVEDDEKAIHTLLTQLSLQSSEIVSEWAAVDSGGGIHVRHGVWRTGRLLGYLVKPTYPSAGLIKAHIAIDESDEQSLNAARVLLTHLLEQVANEPAEIKIEFPRYQVHVREVASALGFRGTLNEHSLTKINLGRIVTNANWSQCRAGLLSVSRLKLPDVAPTFRHCDQQVELLTPDGNKVYATLDLLESLLSPALFCLTGRGAVITPVQRDFSEHLLKHLPQKSLLPQAKAFLYSEKHYLSSSRTLKTFKRGELILFYESLKHGGLGSVVAVGRIRHAYLKAHDALKSGDLDASAIDLETLDAIGKSKMKTVTVFDNVICLQKPVSLQRLGQLGCGRATDLITTRAITSAQLEAILVEGMSFERI